MMKAKKGIVKAIIISAEPLKKKNVEVISSAIVGLAGVNKTVGYTVLHRTITLIAPRHILITPNYFRDIHIIISCSSLFYHTKESRQYIL